MSDPSGKLFDMPELCVSASDLRVHFKDLANEIARGGDPVVITRHGYEMVVLVSMRDYRRIQKQKKEQPDAPHVHPENMPIEEVERWYAATENSTDEPTLNWRRRALLYMFARKRPFGVTPPS